MSWPGIGIALVLTGAVLAGCGDSQRSAEDLWERDFVATSVTGKEDGERPPVQQPPEIELGFGEESDHSVSWTARCNHFGADARVTATRIEVELAYGTEIGCPGGPQREDEWLLEFMESDPEWRLDGSKLTLIANGAEVEWEG